MTDAARTAEQFAAAYGSAPAGVWSAPGRINLIGEHVDYNDGLCLPMALPQRTYAAASPRADRTLRLASAQNEERLSVDLDRIGPGRPPGWAAYPAGVIWALRESGRAVTGLDIFIDSDVPVGSGLSSSAALECAVAVAACDLAGAGVLADEHARAEVALACMRAENVVAQAPTGGMDQIVSMTARPGHALLLDCRDFSRRHIPLDLDSADATVLVIDTNAPHQLVDGQYAARREQCESAAAALGVASLREITPAELPAALERVGDEVLARRLRHVVTEIQRVAETAELLASGGAAAMPEVGRLFSASHRSLRDDYEVSCPELDCAVAAAEDAGAWGARMTGGGFGGSAIALVPSDRASAVLAAVERAFAAAGYAQPTGFTTRPSGGASREA